MLRRLAKAMKRGFRGIGKKGFTLMEVAAVVAVAATLTAVALPVVGDKIKETKIERANQDVQAIRSAILSCYKDTAVPPFYGSGQGSGNATSAQFTLPKYGASSYYQTLASSDGVMPLYGTTTTVNGVSGGSSSSTGTTWASYLATTSFTTRLVGAIEDQLNDNTPKYPVNGDPAWRGPYLPNIKKDPWGNKYLVAIEGYSELEPSNGITLVKAVYVISAGPNGLIETARDQTVGETAQKVGTAQAQSTLYTFATGNDDIIARIK